MTGPPAGRRPLNSRQWTFFQSLAAWLATTSITPNMISVSSVFFATAAGAVLALTPYVENNWLLRGCWIASALCMQGRLVANLLDGMVAIEGGKASAVGELYNEVPDRISDSAIFIGAGLAVGGRLDLGLLAGLVSVFVAYVRAIGASTGVGQVFMGPMAKQQRMALLTLACVLCAVLPTAWQPVHAETGVGIFGGVLIVIVAGGLVTAIRRLLEIARLMRRQAESGEADDV